MSMALGAALWIWMLMVLLLGIVLFGGLYVYDKSIILYRDTMRVTRRIWSSIRR